VMLEICLWVVAGRWLLVSFGGNDSVAESLELCLPSPPRTHE